jgi:hypothetical protein
MKIKECDDAVEGDREAHLRIDEGPDHGIKRVIINHFQE